LSVGNQQVSFWVGPFYDMETSRWKTEVNENILMDYSGESDLSMYYFLQTFQYFNMQWYLSKMRVMHFWWKFNDFT